LSRDGQGKIIGEKIERQFGRAIVRREFGYEIVRRKDKIRRGAEIPEGVRQWIVIQWFVEKGQRSNI